MKTTLKDISRLTGVDVVSVSYTLRQHPRAMELRPGTRDKIIRAARDLGYRRNELAASMRTGFTRTAAVLGRFDQIQTADYDSAVLAGILIEASRLNYGIKIYPVDNLDGSFNQILSYQIKSVISMSVDKAQRLKTAELCLEHGLDLLYIYEDSQGHFPAVNSANHDGAYMAVKHLIELGHQRIALVCAEHDHVYKKEHHAGYLECLNDFGVVASPKLVSCENSQEGTEQQIARMLELPESDRPTAFYCISDSWAMLVERSAIRLGLRIPDDISVIGCGNTLLAGCAASPLTSIAQPFGDIGRTALRVLLSHNTDIVPTSDNRYLLPSRLISRDSVAAASGQLNETAKTKLQKYGNVELKKTIAKEEA